MSVQRFTKGKWIEWQGELYEIKRILPDRQVNMENVKTGMFKTSSIDQLTEELFINGTLSFVIEGKHGKPRIDGRPPIESRFIDLDECPPQLLEIARFRLDVIRPLLKIWPRTRIDVAKRVEEIKNTNVENQDNSNRKISVPSVYRWIAEYKKSDGDLRSLIPRSYERGGKGTWRLEPEQNYIIDAAIKDIYLTRERKTVTDVEQEVARRIEQENLLRPLSDKLTFPTRPTIHKRINALDMKSVFAARYGKRAAKQEFSQTYASTNEATQVLDIAEIDHTPLDLILVDEMDNLPLGRPTLTDMLDVFSRYPLGYYIGFEPPNYYAVMECLYHAIRPKQDVKKIFGTENTWNACGVMNILITDNGKEFMGSSLQDSCELLNILLQRTPIRKPHYKGKVERYFRSQTFTIHGLPGTTFSNPQVRADYDSVGLACLYLKEAEAILNHFLVDISAQQFHKGIKDIPARRWDRALQNGFIPNLPPNANELLILLGQVDYRTVQKYGIDFESLRYNCAELGEFRMRLKRADIREVKIKFHPGDLSQLHVFDPFDKRYIPVPILDKYRDYVQNLSLWKHKVINRFILNNQEEVDIASLGRSKRRIQDLIDNAKKRKKVSRKSEARWIYGGDPPSKVEQKNVADKRIRALPRRQGEVLPITTREIVSGTSETESPIMPAIEDTDWPVIPNPKGT